MPSGILTKIRPCYRSCKKKNLLASQPRLFKEREELKKQDGYNDRDKYEELGTVTG